GTALAGRHRSSEIFPMFGKAVAVFLQADVLLAAAEFILLLDQVKNDAAGGRPIGIGREGGLDAGPAAGPYPGFPRDVYQLGQPGTALRTGTLQESVDRRGRSALPGRLEGLDGRLAGGPGGAGQPQVIIRSGETAWAHAPLPDRSRVHPPLAAVLADGAP